MGGLLLFHGWDEIVSGAGGVARDLASAGLPPMLGYGVYVAEVIAPILILLGLLTRPAALLYCASMAVATLLVHHRDFTRLEPTGGWAAELWAFYTLTPLVVALLGAGRYSVRQGRGRLD